MKTVLKISILMIVLTALVNMGYFGMFTVLFYQRPIVYYSGNDLTYSVSAVAAAAAAAAKAAASSSSSIQSSNSSASAKAAEPTSSAINASANVSSVDPSVAAETNKFETTESKEQPKPTATQVSETKKGTQKNLCLEKPSGKYNYGHFISFRK
jgi:type IV secretory pathway TrbL component